jgi:uncharacterized membrane-anchored protein YhcB (DUF1043 family)
MCENTTWLGLGAGFVVGVRVGFVVGDGPGVRLGVRRRG